MAIAAAQIPDRDLIRYRVEVHVRRFRQQSESRHDVRTRASSFEINQSVE
jgi:hypothetical protein